MLSSPEGQTAPVSSRLEYSSKSNKNTTVLLIHDPLASKSACSVTFNVGSFHEPEQLPGLAHLLEHMLLMGSAGYPEPNTFSSWISECQGYQNAQTCDFTTSFYIEIGHQYYKEAVHRLCDAIKSPLFPEECISVEVEALHEEYVLARDDEEARIQELIRRQRSHKLSKFVMGRRDQFMGKQLRQQLNKFYHEFYSQAQICIVMYSNSNMEQLQQYILTNIGSSKQEYNPEKQRKQTLSNMLNISGLEKESTPKYLQTKSINNEDTLILHFPMVLPDFPSFKQFLQTVPICELMPMLAEFADQLHSLLAYVLCHPSHLSLENYLVEDEGIANSVEVEIVEIVPYTTFAIEIVINLEEESVTSFKQVYQKIMQHINGLTHIDTLEKAFEQVIKISKIEADNFQVQDLQQFICEIGSDVMLFGLPLALSYKYANNNRISQFRDLTLWCVRQFWESCHKIVVLSTPDKLKGKVQVQKYYNIPYTVSQLPVMSQPIGNPTPAHLPENPYLSLDISSDCSAPCPSPCSVPCLIELSPSIRYSPPLTTLHKTGLKLLFHNNESYIFNTVLAEFLDLFTEDLENIGYAEIIGLDFYFGFGDGWFFMEIFGFTALVTDVLRKVGLKLGKLIDDVENGHAKESEDIKDIFEETVENVSIELENFYEEEMDDLTDKIRQQLLIKDCLPTHLMHRELDKIKKNKFLERTANFLKNSLLEWIVVGNIDRQILLALTQKFKQNIKNSPEQNFSFKQTKVLSLSSPSRLGSHRKLEVRLQSADIHTSTCLMYCEGGMFSKKLFWIMEIICHFLEDPFYKWIREKKKLSYDLEVNLVNTRGILGICFMVVSSKVDAELISREINGFLAHWVQVEQLRNRLVNSIEKIKNNVMSKNMEKFATLQQHYDFICGEVETRSYYFEQRQQKQISKQLSSIEVEQIIYHINKMFSNSLEILLVSQEHKKQYGEHRGKISSLEKIKENSQYYKDFVTNTSFKFSEDQLLTDPIEIQ